MKTDNSRETILAHFDQVLEKSYLIPEENIASLNVIFHDKNGKHIHTDGMCSHRYASMSIGTERKEADEEYLYKNYTKYEAHRKLYEIKERIRSKDDINYVSVNLYLTNGLRLYLSDGM